MKIYIPYYENRSWHTATLDSLECNLYKHKGGGYTIFAYNNAVAYNGDNVYSDELGAIAYQCKNYGNANIYKVDVEKLSGKIESEVKNMDNLTQIKKNRLLKDCSNKILETPLLHNDIMKMYAYIYDCTATSDRLTEIEIMETVKASLDFLVRGALK